MAWPSTGSTTINPRNSGSDPIASAAATIRPHTAITPGLVAITRSEVAIAVFTGAGRSSISGNDTTVIDSPNQADTFAPGWANGGEATIKIQLVQQQQATLFGMFRKPLGYRIVFNDALAGSPVGSNLPFDGYIKSIQNEIATKDLVTCEVVVKVSGLPTFNAAA